MTHSTSIQNIAKAMVTFHVKVDTIRKDSTNPFSKSKYASLTAILDAINEPLTESGLSICQFPEDDFSLTTLLMHESGEWISSTYIMKPIKDDPHGRGSVISYQRRYCIQSVLNLNIDDIMIDDDANSGTYPNQTPAQPIAKKETNDLPWLNKDTDEWNRVVNFMKGETADIKLVQKKYRLNKENKTFLLNIKNH
jgi:hypothetical protein